MTKETDTPAGGGGEKGDFGPAIVAALTRQLFPADGVGRLFAETQGFIRESLQPELIEVTEPGTGVEVLAVATKEGALAPVASEFFDVARANPRFRRGTAALTTLASFITHVQRFGDEDTVVFADDSRTAPKLTAVLDYHRADQTDESRSDGDVVRLHGEYRHGKHRSTHAFPLSDEWKAWMAANGKPMSMGAFSVFLEDRIGDIAIAEDDFPEDVERFVTINGGVDAIADYARLVELSRGLKIHADSVMEEAQVMSSGEGALRFSNEHKAKDALGNTVKVPTMFFIAIPIFNKGAFYRIAARLRYRPSPEGLKFWFDLWRADRSFDHAFNEAVSTVDASVPGTVLFGSPEA